MSVPSMDELVEAFKDAALTDPRTSIKVGLLAVLDRLKPVVAEAYAEGRTDHRDGHPFDYATRIIDQIKGA